MNGRDGYRVRVAPRATHKKLRKIEDRDRQETGRQAADRHTDKSLLWPYARA